MKDKSEISYSAPDSSAPGKRIRYVQVKTAVPIWVAALMWIIGAFVFPLYKIYGIILTTGLSLGAGLIAKQSAKPETKRIEEAFSSGNAEVDAAVRELDQAADRIDRDRAVIQEKYPDTAAHMTNIVIYLGKMAGQIIEDPDDLRRSRRFLTYYIPTSVKLADKYAAIVSEGSGANVTETRRSIESAMEQIDNAFERQYDAMYENDALDISTDVTVLETMLKKDGLGGNGDQP